MPPTNEFQNLKPLDGTSGWQYDEPHMDPTKDPNVVIIPQTHTTTDTDNQASNYGHISGIHNSVALEDRDLEGTNGEVDGGADGNDLGGWGLTAPGRSGAVVEWYA